MEKVCHPFIVSFVASFKDKHFVYMVVHVVPGGELFSRIHDVELEKDGIPEEHAKFYSLCLADAIAYLHRMGYVFRGKFMLGAFSLCVTPAHHKICPCSDLKAENVMIDANGYPRLIDFGFAKVRLIADFHSTHIAG